MEKPGALRFARSVGVVIRRRRGERVNRRRALISSAATSTPSANLPDGVRRLRRQPGITVLGPECVLPTQRRWAAPGPHFLNAAALIDTRPLPADLRRSAPGHRGRRWAGSAPLIATPPVPSTWTSCSTRASPARWTAPGFPIPSWPAVPIWLSLPPMSPRTGNTPAPGRLLKSIAAAIPPPTSRCA